MRWDIVIAQKQIKFQPVSAASVSNNSIFLDTADSLLKLKDNAGLVEAI